MNINWIENWQTDRCLGFIAPLSLRKSHDLCNAQLWIEIQFPHSKNTTNEKLSRSRSDHRCGKCFFSFFSFFFFSHFGMARISIVCLILLRFCFCFYFFFYFKSELQFHYRCARVCLFVAEDHKTTTTTWNVHNWNCIISHGEESFKRNAMCDQTAEKKEKPFNLSSTCFFYFPLSLYRSFNSFIVFALVFVFLQRIKLMHDPNLCKMLSIFFCLFCTVSRFSVIRFFICCVFVSRFLTSSLWMLVRSRGR